MREGVNRRPYATLLNIAHAMPLTSIAGIGHWLLGSVNWLLLSSPENSTT